MSENSKILIMCGGRGKRMGKITDKIPKPLIKIQQRTILEHKIRNYYDQGFNRFILAVGYKADMIKESLRQADFNDNIDIEFSHAGEKAGILERIDFAKNSFEDRIILTYGDTITNIQLLHLVKSHESGEHEVTIVTAPILSPFGLVEFDDKNKVTEFKEKPILKYYIGYAIINKSSLVSTSEKIVKGIDGKGLIEYYKLLISKQKLGAYHFSGLQITFNTQDELKIANTKIIDFYTSKER